MDAIPAITPFTEMYSESAPNASQEMAMEPLVGTEEATVDDKGRIRLSVKKQDRLGEKFALFHDPVGCILALPRKVWRQKLHEILSQPASLFDRDIETRDVGSMSEDDISADGQGRFVIPQRMRDDLKLTPKSPVMIVGAIDRVEIWPKADHDKFAAAKKANAKARREMAEKGVLRAE
ncbi:MAG: division/cell wall cluster transcriptional repressor MraZ [Fimbriimonadales bacterium]